MFKRPADMSFLPDNGPPFRPLSAPNNVKSGVGNFFGGPTNGSGRGAEDIYGSGNKKVQTKGSINSFGQLNAASNNNSRVGQNKASSMVDRALNFAKSKTSGNVNDGKEKLTHDFTLIPPSRKEVSQMAHLTNMFDDTVIDRLDCIILPPKQR
jgi:hypothetical protein